MRLNFNRELYYYFVECAVVAGSNLDSPGCLVATNGGDKELADSSTGLTVMRKNNIHILYLSGHCRHSAIS